MADEQVQEQQVEAEPVRKKKGFLKILLIACLAAVLLGGAGCYFYGQKLMAYYLGSKGGATHAKPKQGVGPILPLEPFVFNVSGNYAKLARISVAMELKDSKAVEEVKKMAPVVRDVMLSVLGAKTPEHLMDVGARSQVKKELHESVAGLFKQGDLRAVYITDIIMQ